MVNLLHQQPAPAERTAPPPPTCSDQNPGRRGIFDSIPIPPPPMHQQVLLICTPLSSVCIEFSVWTRYCQGLPCFPSGVSPPPLLSIAALSPSSPLCLCVHVSEGCPVGFPECPPLYVSVCPRAVTSVSRRPAPACALGAASDYKSRQPPRRAGGRGAAEGGAGLGGAQSLTAAPSPPLQLVGPAGVPGRPAPQRPAPPAFRLGPDRGASRRPGPAMSARSRHERR